MVSLYIDKKYISLPNTLSLVLKICIQNCISSSYFRQKKKINIQIYQNTSLGVRFHQREHVHNALARVHTHNVKSSPPAHSSQTDRFQCRRGSTRGQAECFLRCQRMKVFANDERKFLWNEYFIDQLMAYQFDRLLPLQSSPSARRLSQFANHRLVQFIDLRDFCKNGSLAIEWYLRRIVGDWIKGRVVVESFLMNKISIYFFVCVIEKAMLC